MGFGGVAIAALYFVLRFGLAFSDGLGGVLLKKTNPEVQFYGASGRVFMLFGVLPDSNNTE